MLHALRDYGAKLGGEPGFKVRDVRWRIDIGSDGRFLGVLPLGSDKKGQPLDRCPDMRGMNAGGRAHFLIENALHAVLLVKGDEDKNKREGVRKRHLHFVRLIKDAAAELTAMQPLAEFIQDESRLRHTRDALTAAGAKPPE